MAIVYIGLPKVEENCKLFLHTDFTSVLKLGDIREYLKHLEEYSAGDTKNIF
jgi:hypothetical protein